jgi:hypothetical protein
MTANRSAMIFSTVLIAVTLALLWGGAVPAATAQTIVVTAADPPSGAQGTINLNVLIKGKGFKIGAIARFYRTGTSDADGIVVKSTTFRGATELVANIDIADWAALSKFDIEVMNVGGRTGKGTELFSVTKKSTACVIPDLLPTLSTTISDMPGSPGYLDSTFGNVTGRVISSMDMDIWGAGVAVDGVGRIVTAGDSSDSCVNNGSAVRIIARYLPNGGLDSSFGTGGVVRTTSMSSVNGMAIDGDNRIVIVGTAPPKKGRGSLPAVGRFNVNGSLDTSFGGTGIVLLPFSSGWMEAVTFDGNGRI